MHSFRNLERKISCAMKKTTSLLYLLSVLFSCSLAAQEINIETFSTGFNRPLNIQNAGDDRLFVVEQSGFIQIVQPDGSINSDPFLDLLNKVSNGGERGLLGLAFHPDYQQNGQFFVYYTNTSGDSQLSRFNVSESNSNIANPSSELSMLTIEQPFDNHNGGCLAFGPDGYLYVSVGDGGGAGDTGNRAQNPTNLFGSILRLDVDGEEPYTIPDDNPFKNSTSNKEEIWAYGLRNPWKFSFDSENGELWIADVGQGNLEEINKVSPNDAGLNYGWRCYEGSAPYNTKNCPDSNTLTFPVTAYSHSNDGLSKCSITGGYVYRGSEFPNMVGKYIFADYCSNEIGMLTADGSDDYEITYFGPFAGNLSSFGEDNSNSIYVAGVENGIIYKVLDSNALHTEKSSKNEFVLYPNPAHDSLFITQSQRTATTLTIYDVLGKLVAKKEIKNIENEVDISSLKRGVYLMQMGGNDKQETHKLIIN